MDKTKIFKSKQEEAIYLNKYKILTEEIKKESKYIPSCFGYIREDIAYELVFQKILKEIELDSEKYLAPTYEIDQESKSRSTKKSEKFMEFMSKYSKYKQMIFEKKGYVPNFNYVFLIMKGEKTKDYWYKSTRINFSQRVKREVDKNKELIDKYYE